MQKLNAKHKGINLFQTVLQNVFIINDVRTYLIFGVINQQIL